MKAKVRAWKGWIIFFIGLIMAGRTVVKIWNLWQVRQIVTEAEVRVNLAKTENEQLQKRLSEVSNDAFVEKEARDKLGMGKPGETILILPNQNNTQYSEKSTQGEIPNWKKWWDLYVGLP